MLVPALAYVRTCGFKVLLTEPAHTCMMDSDAAAPARAIDQTVKQMGLSPLKEKQTEAILSVVARKDTFVSLPTGYGKSIIYGIFPPLFDKSYTIQCKFYNIMHMQCNIKLLCNHSL